jgi:hypothetical protein
VIYVVHLELQIDVHYSLPRDDNLAKGGDKNQVWKGSVSLALVLKPVSSQELQGALLVTLRNSNQIIDDGEVRRKFQQFGDVKSIRPAAERHELAILLLGLNHRTNTVTL